MRLTFLQRKSINLLCLGIIIGFSFIFIECLPCDLRKYKDGYVCVCNATYCDTLENVIPDDHLDYVLVSSSKNGLRFNISKGQLTNVGSKRKLQKITVDDLEVESDENISSKQFFGRNEAEITINVDMEYQKMLGFGAAFVGTVSYNLNLISQNLRNNIYKSFYSLTEGIGFNMARMSIGGSDFDNEPWAYNELPIDDKTLSNFTKLDDRDLRIIEQIKNLKQVSNNYDIKLMAAAWSSPVWMKTNGQWTGLSALKEEYYQTWADYHVRYLELMEAEGLNFWAISTGNEPMNGLLHWAFLFLMSLGWTARNQALWIGNNFGPTIRNSKFKDIKIFSNEDQRYTFPWWFIAMKWSHNKSVDYLDGIAVHWYMDTYISAEKLNQTHDLFPDKIIMNTEASIGANPIDFDGPLLGSWDRAETYIYGFMEDFKHWIQGWIDWNLLVNEFGGPNNVGRHVDAPLIVNATADEAYKQPMFHVFGHFSRFVIPDSVRIEVYSDNTDVKAIGFKREDSRIVIVFYNKNDWAMNVVLVMSIDSQIEINVPPKSLHTFIYQL